MFIKAQDIELKFAQMIALPEPITIKVADKHKFKFKRRPVQNCQSLITQGGIFHETFIRI